MTDERNDLPEIAPRDDGFCPSTAACPQFFIFHKAHLCKINGVDYDMEGHICPVWATRTAARLEAVEAWADEAAEYITGSEPYVRMYGLECVKDRIDPLLSTFSGKDGQ